MALPESLARRRQPITSTVRRRGLRSERSVVVAVAGAEAFADAVGDSLEVAVLADIQRLALSADRRAMTSRIRPGRGDMTTMRVDRYTASAIEWVTKTTVFRCAARAAAAAR